MLISKKKKTRLNGVNKSMTQSEGAEYLLGPYFNDPSAWSKAQSAIAIAETRKKHLRQDCHCIAPRV